MVKALRILFGVVAAVFALLMLVLASWAATFTEHKVRPFEREHLDAAVRFLRDRELATGAIPDGPEFEQWARAMDSKGYYRFDGYGYTLDKRCGSKASEFCIGFWTGDAFVTYRSWQASMDNVRLDDSPLPLAFGLLSVGLLAVIASKLLLVPRKRMLAGARAHEG